MRAGRQEEGGGVSRWWRAHDEAIDDPKLQRLPGDLFKAWFNLCCLTSANGGILPAIEDVAFKLRVSEKRAIEILEDLSARGLIDEIEGKMQPHNWDVRQFKSDVSTDRVNRFRKRHRNVSPAVSETPPETETETEKKDSEANASGADAPIDPSIAEREYFQRGKQILGKSAGGLLAKLLKAKGGNVALARSAIESASTKQDPVEYVVRATTGPPATPALLKETKKMEWENARQKLRHAAYRDERGDETGGSPVRVLPAVGSQ